jgi:hypothetical protein
VVQASGHILVPDELVSAPQGHILLKYSIFGKGVALTANPVKACGISQVAAIGDPASPAEDDVGAYLRGSNLSFRPDIDRRPDLGAIIHTGAIGNEYLVSG